METKLVFQAELARHLLKQGYRIVDIKPRKENPQSTVFVFEVKEGIMDILTSWKKK